MPRLAKSPQDAARRLSFLWAFLANFDLFHSGAAQLIDLSQPNGSRWFKNDDINLSYIFRIFEKCGCSLHISLVREGDTATAPAPPAGGTPLLSFITQARKRYGITQADWAEAAGVSKQTVYLWHKADDLMWSQVCLLAQRFGLRIRIRTAPLPADGYEPLISFTTTYTMPELQTCKRGNIGRLSEYWERKRGEEEGEGERKSKEREDGDGNGNV